MIEVTLRNHLLADQDVKRLVGGRVYPLAAPENAEFPLVIYRRGSTSREYVMDRSCGQAKASVELAILASPEAGVDQYAEIKAVAEAVRVALDGFTQRLPTSPALGSVRITYVQITSESDEVFGPVHDEGQDSMGVSMTLEVAFTEPVRVSM